MNIVQGLSASTSLVIPYIVFYVIIYLKDWFKRDRSLFIKGSKIPSLNFICNAMNPPSNFIIIQIFFCNYCRIKVFRQKQFLAYLFYSIIQSKTKFILFLRIVY